MMRPGDWIEFGVEGSVRRRFRQLRARSMHRSWSKTPWPKAAVRQSPTVENGRRAPASRSQCSSAARRPSIAPAREMTLLADGTYHLAVGSTEMGNGSVTSHRQIAAEVLGTRADAIDIINADTDLTPYDTGTFASTGTVVAGQAVEIAAAALRDNIIEFASRHTGVDPAHCRLDAGTVVCGKRRIALPDLHARRRQGRTPFRGQAQGLSLAAHGRLQRPRHPARGAPHDRRNPHPAERARRRYRPPDQSDAVPRPDRRRDRAWRSAGR